MPETIVNGSIVQTVTDDAYAAGWDGSNDVPTKNAIYDKIQSLGSSGLTPIKTQAFSGVSSVAFINGTSSVVFDGTYKAYLLVYRLNPATDAVNLYLRTIPSGSTPDSGASDYAYKNYTVTNSVSNSDSNGAAQIRLDGDNIGNAAGEGQTGFIIFHDPADTTLQKTVEHFGTTINSTTSKIAIGGSGARLSTAAIIGFALLASSGNITGTATLYGLANAA